MFLVSCTHRVSQVELSCSEPILGIDLLEQLRHSEPQLVRRLWPAMRIYI